MTEYEFFLCVLGALIALCLVSFIIIVATNSGKGVQIAFCIVSVLCLALSIFLMLNILGVIKLDISLPLDGKKAVALIFALAIVASGELSCLLFKRDVTVQKIVSPKVEQKDTVPAVISDNIRRAGERKHGDYVIKR